ncbi:MAG: hypothetical protein EKD82_02130 [Candidatus Symbiopectobacterium sp. PLON1]|nr:hypothetical protein [Candidatus Symbiopectobacterium sp. PLON1]
MLVVSSFEITESGKRTQPCGQTEGHEYRAGRYYNFRENPELIETQLEDFSPYSDRPAIKLFYSFLKWINGNDSALESTDCLLSGEPTESPSAYLFHCSHKNHGRVEFFVRNIETNADKKLIIWIYDKLSLYLQIERPDFRKGSLRITPLITDYIRAGRNELTGYRFCIHFYAYGNGVEDTWVSLNAIFDNIMKATKRLNSEMITGDAVPLYEIN